MGWKLSRTVLFFAFRYVFIFVALPALASATSMTSVVCSIVGPIVDAVYYACGTLVVIMFTYGGVKYIFSADDPAGRKQGKSICVHSIIGGIIISAAYPFYGAVGLSASSICCSIPGIPCST